MSRVLIIKNADFSENRVAHVEFDGVPCTGISLEESTISVTGDTPVTVEYTVTPADTTDDIVWTSSDTSVATVSGNVITIVGIGSTTITATCGSFSDSLTMTCDLYANPDWFSASAAIITNSNGVSIVRADLNDTIVGKTRLMAAQLTENSEFEIPIYSYNDIGYGAFPIRIPNNCARINVVASGLYNSGNTILFVDATEFAEYLPTVTSCKAISSADLTTSSYATNITVDVPQGASGFVVGFRMRNSGVEGETIAEAGEALNLSIHFLPAATEG